MNHETPNQKFSTIFLIENHVRSSIDKLLLTISEINTRNFASIKYLRRVDRLKHILSHKHVVAELNIMRSWNGQVMRYQHPEIIPKDFK